VEVVRTYLALDRPSQFRDSRRAPAVDARLLRLDPCPVPVYRRLYKEVGGQWYWHDRLEWSDDELATYLASPEVRVWEATVRGGSAGYFELRRHDDGGVEIAYFGLVPAFIGRGIGRWLLEHAVREAWAFGATRVWLHTCTLDSEHALPNYLARGFTPYKTERLDVDIDGTQVVAERLLSS
jgi:GNAT superfamily N-acetyltransferase